ncbi:glutathione S-transferase family protein [Burkholderia ambifaria]|uniref:glutathione S-transferase family protein n=1 Tax=Burkholderia ambifaria TaxID=152480 RepID=UPI00158DAF5C|nr:glutathione S-transferase family protein [Burkholderia ambifaria]
MTMPTLTLISHPLCPFVQRAAIVLLEKQVPFQRINVDLSDKPAWFLEISPTGKVPVLQVQEAGGSNEVLFESVAICEYLQETHSGPSLYPDDPLERAKHRAWIEFGSATLAEAWGYLNANDHVTANVKATLLKDKLAQLEKVLGLGPYFDGETFGMVDAVFAPVFRYFDVLQTDSGPSPFPDFPKVDAWRERLRVRASVIAAVSADYPALFRAHLRRQKALLMEEIYGASQPYPATSHKL